MKGNWPVGRPERPVDPESGPVQRLAHELRELRRTAGSPPYRSMAQTAGFSVTSLAQAAGGERLPSLAVLRGYVQACGGEPADWELRWKAAKSETLQRLVDGAEDASSPYRGLARFEPDHHNLFFGRDRLVEELCELVSQRRFAALFGASGSGKSSLLRAGLIPGLQQEIARGDHPAVLRILTPGPRPAATYRHLLTPSGDEPESWVVVDQFEEVFTLCKDRAERSRFIDLLLAAREPGSRLRVLIAVRADFYVRCSEHRGLADSLKGVGLPVGPMTADELREAITRPAQAAGLLVERELTARIIEEVLDQPGALPMLSHALLETWRGRKGRLLKLADYEAVGGVSGAIAGTAEEFYAQLSAGQQSTARHLMLRLIEPGQGSADTRRPLSRSELEEWVDPDVAEVVERLTRARLLSVDEDGVQLAHEALITNWPRLGEWIGEDRERLRHHRSLTVAARTWLEHDRDPGVLYRGTRLARAEELFANDGSLTVSERSFLLAALAAREAEEQAATHAARRSRLLISSLSAMLVAALVVGLAAWQQHRDNGRQRTETAARRIAAVADSLRSTDPRTAMLLGVAAWRISPLPESRRSLLGSLTQPELGTFNVPAPGERPERFLADAGRTLLSIDGRIWRRWDVATGRRTASGRLPDGTVLAVGPNARVLAIGDSDGARLWDTIAGRWTGAAEPVNAIVDFGVSDRSYVVIGIEDDRAQLRSIADGSVLFETRGVPQGRMVAGPGDRLVAVCPAGKAPQVWEIGARRALPGDWEDARGSCDGEHETLAFNGAQLAVLSTKGVRVWDIASGRRVADIDAPGVQSVAFTRDGDFLATADSQEIRVWRLSDHSAPAFRHPLNSQRLQYSGLAWDATRPVLRYLEGGTVHLLDLSATVTSAWRERPLAKELLSPDGRFLATAERSGSHYRFQLRNIRDGHVLTLPAPPLPVSSDRSMPLARQDRTALLAFSPDSAALAYGVSAPGLEAAPQRFTVWDTYHERARTSLNLATPVSLEGVGAIALGPGGHTLYADRTPPVGDPGIETWDTARRRKTAVISAGAGAGFGAFRADPHLVVRPDGHLLIDDDRTVRAGKAVARDLVQGDGVSAIAFAPDSSRLAVGDLSGRVALWNSALRHRTGILRNVFPVSHDAPETVSALAFSPDGRTLAVGGTEGTLQLWDTATQQPLGGPVATPGESIDTLAFSTDSGILYAGSAHIPLQRYTVDAKRAVRQVCERAGGTELTREQWGTYIPDAPYRKLCSG
ncbi:hypothetical protein HUT05_16435 [Streptomyces chartreusis]|uniref:Novel STAND NTPase 1 domain-containing protein n=2 Tax=Streptomyces chartreusis TaxID=1969 RepID=A0A7H8TMY3_STRCX|nr:hypothetical protein HUT05_16435 [Streptomyces chartreusis]